MDAVDCWFAALIGLLLGAALSAILINATWEKDAIRAGAAHYEKTTGLFKWNGDTQ